MDMRLVIEHMRQAGLDVEADAVIAISNEVLHNTNLLRAQLAELEAMVDAVSAGLAEVYRRLEMMR
jgi:hypothetical protein